MRSFALLLSFCWLACHPSQGRHATPPQRQVAPPSGQSARATVVTFGRVLEIAASQSPTAHEDLSNIIQTVDDGDVRVAAQRIISLWNTESRTYFSTTPLPLRRECVDESLLRDIRQRITQATSVDVELAIDSSGTASDIVILRSSGNAEVDRIVRDELRRRHYLPAKPDTDYLAGTLRLKCWIDVR